jgi:signal peptidase I
VAFYLQLAILPEARMDLTMLAVGLIVISSVIIGWDLSARRTQTEPPSDGQRNIAELAHYVLFFAGLGLLLKFMSFAAVLLIATVLTGVIWGWNTLVGAKARPETKPEPMFVELARGFFPVILIVFMVRSFLVEPFKIPSGSMIPTLLIGDFILVNKYTYGIRLPVINKKVVEINEPKRGDVMVFRYPVDPSVDYIKRVIGLPGDRVEYRDKRLTINGVPQPMKPRGSYTMVESGLNATEYQLMIETLGGVSHPVILNAEAAPVYLAGVRQFPHKENCTYNDSGFACKVPAGHYFMMGDNRDGSSDSRIWGFVPEENIVGRAFLIWWNFGDFKRIGSSVN